MRKKVILFDLDGTLLPQDQDKFIAAYFGVLARKLTSIGFPYSDESDKDKLTKGIWAATHAMMKNDGSAVNEDRFFSTFGSLTGFDIESKKDVFDEFYKNEFQAVSATCYKNPLIPEIISKLKEDGYRIAVATNPLFPLIANKYRLQWAGLDINDFEYCTSYETSRYCKPNLKYYEAILDHLSVSAEDCLMVGNDVVEDMVARELGIEVFLVTDCIINSENRDINDFPHGSWNDFLKFIE